METNIYRELQPKALIEELRFENQKLQEEIKELKTTIYTLKMKQEGRVIIEKENVLYALDDEILAIEKNPNTKSSKENPFVAKTKILNSLVLVQPLKQEQTSLFLPGTTVYTVCYKPRKL
jgi:hypothetical protein